MSEPPEPPVDCRAGGQGWSDLLQRLQRSALAHRTPIAGSLALTHRCNLRCVHCYLQRAREQAELSTVEWLDILDQIQAAGCLLPV